MIAQFYRKAPYFNHYKPFFEEIYLGNKWLNLSDLNQYIIKKIAIDLFRVKAKFEDSRAYNLTLKKAERVRELLVKAKADQYLSGPAAKDYLQESFLEEVGIKLEWMDYSNYPEYPQLYPPFEHYVSIIDLLFMEGENAVKFMKTF